MGGGFSIGAGERDHALVYLDAHHHALLFDQLGEGLAVVGLLVESLVEEDDSADAGVDPLVGGEEELAVQSAVLLRVLRADAAEALGHAACRSAQRRRRKSKRDALQTLHSRCMTQNKKY